MTDQPSERKLRDRARTLLTVDETMAKIVAMEAAAKVRSAPGV